jgi:glycosyltransferase involved in cell wall biosynthesis
MILFIGPLPPPVHGFAVINGAMLARFRSVTEVVPFNRTPHASRAGRLLPAYLAALWSAPPGSAVYIGLSGGWGQLKDLPYLLAARLLGRPVLVHHHSFAYLHQRPWHARWVLLLLRSARHITLCSCMAELLCSRYGIPPEQVEALSNAAFLPPAPALVQRPAGTPLRLGFLSNITTEKGIWDYFALLDALALQGLAAQGWVAGPVAADIDARFRLACSQRAGCRHLGALYGDAKHAFLDAIDVLIFPTRYANEAEPLAVLEALSAGVPVVACARGCIAELLPPQAGVAYAADGPFVAQACATLRAWVEAGPKAWALRRQAAQAAFTQLQAGSAEKLAQIVARTAAGGVHAT